MRETNEIFVEVLEKSNKAVKVVADWLSTEGFKLDILPHKICPNTKDRFDYVDDGDIEIRQRVEVKCRENLDFQSLEDIPYDSIIIDEKYKIDKRDLKTLYAYIILNSSKTACMIIFRNTYKKWFVDTRYDRRERNSRTYYFCPKSEVIFSKI